MDFTFNFVCIPIHDKTNPSLNNKFVLSYTSLLISSFLEHWIVIPLPNEARPVIIKYLIFSLFIKEAIWTLTLLFKLSESGLIWIRFSLINTSQT